MSGYTYPGVYIQELPSAVHTITGVPTSIVAFVGWAAQGPTTEATLIQSWQEFQTQFGGLDARSRLGYAVYQFYAIAGSGSSAYIVRLAFSDANTASVAGVGGTLNVSANSPGAWGNSLQISITQQQGNPLRFSLQVLQAQNGTTKALEGWANLSATPNDPLNVATVVNSDSQYVTVATTSGSTTSTTISGPEQSAAPVTNALHGRLAAATYYYVVTAVFGNLESLPSAEQSVTTTGTTSSNVISWTAAKNYNGAAPTGYKVYRGTAAGQESVFYNVGNVLSYTDTGTTAYSGSPNPSIGGVPLQGGSDGTVLSPGDGNFETALLNDPSGNGLPLLDPVPIFNLLCIPGESDAATIQSLQQYCNQYRAFYIVDCPQNVTTSYLAANGPVGTTSGTLNPNSNLTGQFSINSAYYYPWVSAADPLAGNRPALFPPSGFVAGIYAATDASRNVWKAPAGIDATLSAGVTGLQYVLTDAQNGSLNPQAINCLRQFKVYGNLVWGARTLNGNDKIGSQWKYVPIRRLALFLESSLYDGTQWVVFEPNDERLWGQIRLNVGTFMQGLFLQGAFQGTTPQQAYFVKCDSEINPQASIDQGIVNILVGFAPLYPAEFVIIQIQQMAGQLQS